MSSNTNINNEKNSNINTNSNNSKCCKFGGINLTLYSTIVAIILAKDLSADQLNILSCFLQAVGQNLSIISIYENICESTPNDTTL